MPKFFKNRNWTFSKGTDLKDSCDWREQTIFYFIFLYTQCQMRTSSHWTVKCMCVIVSMLCCCIPFNVQVHRHAKHWSILRAVFCGVLGKHRKMALMKSTESWDFSCSVFHSDFHTLIFTCWFNLVYFYPNTSKTRVGGDVKKYRQGLLKKVLWS